MHTIWKLDSRGGGVNACQYPSIPYIRMRNERDWFPVENEAVNTGTSGQTSVVKHPMKLRAMVEIKKEAKTMTSRMRKCLVGV